MQKNHMYTKEEIKKIVNLWVDHSMAEICEEMNLKPIQVGYIIKLLRDEGVVLSRKHNTGTTRSLIKEVINELNLCKKDE